MKRLATSLSNISIQEKITELAERANAIKADPRLRHAPNKHDVHTASENAHIMQASQYEAINSENGSDKT